MALSIRLSRIWWTASSSATTRVDSSTGPRSRLEVEPLGLGPAPVGLDARLDHRRDRQRAVVEDLVARLQPGQAEQVEDQLVEPVGLLLDPVEEPDVDVLVVQGPVEQGLGVRLDRGQRASSARARRWRRSPAASAPGGGARSRRGRPGPPPRATGRAGSSRGRPGPGGSTGAGPRGRAGRSRPGTSPGPASVASTASWICGLRISSGTSRPTACGPEPEQPVGALVGEQEPAPGVDGDHALGHPAQDHAELLDVAAEPADPLLDRRERPRRRSGPAGPTGPATRVRVGRTGRPSPSADQAALQLADRRAGTQEAPGRDRRRQGDGRDRRSPRPSRPSPGMPLGIRPRAAGAATRSSPRGSGPGPTRSSRAGGRLRSGRVGG